MNAGQDLARRPTVTTLADLTAEARRIVDAATERNIILRLLGGMAVRIHSPSATHRALARSYPDLDLAYPGKHSSQVETLLTGLGYASNKAFNLLNGHHRLLFYDETYQRQVDIFVGNFQMCHRIPMTDRLVLEPLTLPLAELFLTKIQIVQLNEKDLRDLCALLLDHPWGDGDDEKINLPYVAGMCADDWGLWKTVELNTARIRNFCRASELESGQKALIEARLDQLSQALETVPKTLKWKIRSKVGERVQWYELPEEVER